MGIRLLSGSRGLYFRCVRKYSLPVPTVSGDMYRVHILYSVQCKEVVMNASAFILFRVGAVFYFAL